MSILEVRDVSKKYTSFTLAPTSFSLAPGAITGFIGRNGAGKSTLLKSLLGIVTPDAGEITFFGLPFAENAAAIKQRLGFVAGGVDYYAAKPLQRITAITKRFYPNWDDALYRRYLQLFQLDERKTPAQLSAGMQVKYALALALSHHAELLLLDEPTSGLDPVSRSEVLELLLQLRQQGVTILFSTHITSDLEQCADRILYLQHGRLLADTTLEIFRAAYGIVTLPQPSSDPRFIGCVQTRDGCTALVHAADVGSLAVRPADLSEIMVHLEKEADKHARTAS